MRLVHIFLYSLALTSAYGEEALVPKSIILEAEHFVDGKRKYGDWTRVKVDAFIQGGPDSWTVYYEDPTDHDHRMNVSVFGDENGRVNPDYPIHGWRRHHARVDFALDDGPTNWYLNDIGALVGKLDKKMGKMNSIMVVNTLEKYELSLSSVDTPALPRAVQALKGGKFLIYGYLRDNKGLIEIGVADKIGDKITDIIPEIVFDTDGNWSRKINAQPTERAPTKVDP